MVQTVLEAAIETLNNAASVDQQIAALRLLKNEAVGHDQRKELMVRRGLVDILIAVLSTATKVTGKRRRSDVNGTAPLYHSHSWSHEDQARLQAVLLLGTLANGGASFVQPLLAAGSIKALLDIFTSESAPKLVTAALQALKSIASAWSAALESIDGFQQQTLDIFSRSSVEVFLNILQRSSSSSGARQQLRLVADIIALTSVDEMTRTTLTNAQILDALAALLVSHSVENQFIEFPGDVLSLPPAPAGNVIPNIISAICAIIAESTYRAYAFFLSPAVRDLFQGDLHTFPNQRQYFGPRYGFAYGKIPLLPPVHISTNLSMSYGAGGSRNFPALGNVNNIDPRAASNFNAAQQGGDADHANAVCGWLIVYARSLENRDRLKALRLLALVNNAIDTDFVNQSPRNESLHKGKEREKQLCVLAVPLAVQLVQISAEGWPAPASVEEQAEAYQMRKEACDVLALLISARKELQAAAIDAGAIKYVCPILKKSFDNVSLAKPMWSTRSSSDEDLSDTQETRRVGQRGIPNEVIHAMKCRKSALEAVAALAAKEDIHRKAVVDSGVVPCIIDSMKPFAPGHLASLVANRSQMHPKDGNTISVILAACHAAVSMSRSVAALRTSLIDAGLGKPILSLLTHDNVDVQIAATNVCANLVLEFSALREDFVNEGVIKTLTEHARSTSPTLRLPSLWALKHLVLSAPKDIKIHTLEELGTGWLVGAIQGDQRDTTAIPSSTGGVGVGLSTPNAAGEQVDLLNPSSMDIDEPAQAIQDVDEREDGEVLYDALSSTHYQASQLRSTLNPPPIFDSKKYLSSVKEMETNPSLQAKRDDFAVQEQALDFVRNLLNGEDCATMFEHLIAQIGGSKIFDLLTSKLAPVRTSSAGRPVYNPTELLLSTIHLLAHICNASPRHRQLVIAQKQLLQAWLPHFNHVHPRVRGVSVWAVISLTWLENGSDQTDARQRMRELKIAGIESAVRGLQNDVDLDVRQRAKTALQQIEVLS
ncbi:ARM repeat-containing protein [Acrodontium crateriforme]|uniref:ARM repeat-containing protein n=1 Tax=Acrodontium crateriforme TaxID=150365 RepID=A0AAQ3M9L9_9PEZI|nr:ARM repeat-containing protein [Acrodontium crateriforme]